MRDVPLLKDWPLKLLAVVLSVVVWLRVVGEERYLWELQVPLELRNLPAALTFADDVPSIVTVRVRAPRPVLERLKVGEIDAQVDMSQAKPGGNFFQLSKDDIRVPFGVEIVSISPPSIRMDVQPKVTKMVPVIPDVRGQPPDDYELRGVSVTPKEVAVEGPEGAVAELVEVTTEAVRLSGRTAPFVERVNVDPKTTKVRLKAAGPVTVEILIAEKTLERTFTGIPVQTRPASEGSRIEPARVTATIVGPVSVVRGLAEENIAAYVNVSAADPQATLRAAPVVEVLPIEVGNLVTVKDVVPSQVQVRLVAATPQAQASADPPADTIARR